MANNTKQQAINTFTGGLNTDLHPLTTPNDILTDCINGTIITYNGNEYILQNDMGNYQLKNTVLTPNYIPIGVKEYAGVIYIVSYNPIEKLTEIGSYPSPQTIFDSEHNNEREAKYIDLAEEYSKYTVLSKQQAIQLYSTEETFMLNPGDKYYLYLQLEQNKVYQTIEFYVLSQEKNLFPLRDEQVKKHELDNPDRDDYSPVTWEIPGWLAYKFRLATIDQFNLYLTKLNQPGFTKENNSINLDYSVTAQAITSDMLFDNSSLLEKLKVWIAVGYIDEKGNKNYIFSGETKKVVKDSDFASKVDHGLICNISDIKYTSINKFLFTKDIDPSLEEEFFKLNIPVNSGTKTVFVEAIPLIQDAETNKHIIYDNFETTLIIDLDNIKDITEIAVFDTYKYLVSNDDVTLNYTITSPLATVSNLLTELRIYKITKGTGDKYNLKLAWAQELNEINYLGQNITTCNFKDSAYVIDNEKEPLTEVLEKEEIYLLQLRIYIDGKAKTQYQNWHRMLITSELMNPFYNTVKDFSTIDLATWINQLKNYVDLPDVTLEDKNDIINNMSIYRNTGVKNRIYRLVKETNGELWQNTYSVETDTLLDSSVFPAIGVNSSDTITVKNYEVSVLNNDGIWNNEIDWNFSFDVKTSKNSLKFDKRNLENTIDLYKRYKLDLVQQAREEKNWDRVYIYDYCQCTKRSDRKKKINDSSPYYYWGWQTYDYTSGGSRLNHLERRKLSSISNNPPSLLNNTWKTSDPNGGGSRDGFYNWWTNDQTVVSPYMFIWFDAKGSKQWWRMSAYFDHTDQVMGIRIGTKISTDMVWCIVPMNGGKMDIGGKYNSDEVKNQLLGITNQFAVHIFAYVPSTGSSTVRYYLLTPNYIITDEKLSETITTGNYTWKFNNVKWNEKNITENTVSKNTLLLNGLPIISSTENVKFNNVKSATIGVEKSKFKNINLIISSDLTSSFKYKDFDTNIDRETNIDDIKLDIDNFLYTMKDLSSKRQELTDKLNSINPYTVAHDLDELSDINIRAEVKTSYDTFVSSFRAEKMASNSIRFYSIYANHIDVVHALKIGSGGNNKGQTDHGYYLPPTSTFQLPIYEEQLWTNVSDKFKDNE